MQLHPWFGYALILLGVVGTMVIRAPHGTRSRKVRVVESRKDALEVSLVVLVSLSMVVMPLLSLFTGLFAFADFPLHPYAFWAGTPLLMFYFWLFYRSHADLGVNWSVSLELRENHSLVTRGVYSRIRHPMYTALFAYGLAQLLLLPNWLAGGSFLVSFTLLYFLRIGREERMMHEQFGAMYTSYVLRTKRLVPFLF